MEDNKQIKYDLDGHDVVKDAVLELINQIPFIQNEMPVTFAVLEEKQGFAMIPVSSSVIESSRKSITGKVTEVCYYPFALVYRDMGMNERRKSEVAKLLDDIGRYLEQKEVAEDEETYKLKSYPALTGNRKFLEIVRQSNSYLANVAEDKSEDWEIRITARYQNEYK